MFPAGLPGAALLLLRIVVAGILLVSTLSSESVQNISPWKALLLAVTGVLLFLGAFTPLASAISIVIEATYWPGWDGLKFSNLALHMLVSIAVFILGPGAYSIDSKMFGRRRILPKSE
jgi:uncharacterized membrane protein YphA (DoxX/SURF4 family)